VVNSSLAANEDSMTEDLLNLSRRMESHIQQLTNELKHLIEVCDTNLEMETDLRFKYAKTLLHWPNAEVRHGGPDGSK
jgi:hypothetical protein